jgi:nitrogenase molybdenum-iron protein alpha/beta subunit
MSCASGHRAIPLQADQEPLVPPTALTEIDMVRGTRRQLEESVRNLHKVYDPTMIVVILTCATSLISEDHEPSMRDLSLELGCPILIVDGSAMAGDEVEGYGRFTQALETCCLPGDGSGALAVDCIYLRGLAPTDWAINTDLVVLSELLDQGLGLQTEGAFLVDFDLHTGARLLHCAPVRVGWLWAEAGDRSPAPYGIAGTQRWLADVARMLGREDSAVELPGRPSLKAQLAEIRETARLQHVRVAIEGLSWWSVGLARFLREELGCTILLSTDERGIEYQHTSSRVAEITLLDIGNLELLMYVDDFQPHVVFGSSYLKNGPWHWVPFYQPVWHPTEDTPSWMGLRGALRIATMLAELGDLYA